MKVLMLGWELPPKITGGLGVACQGLFERLCEREDLSLCIVVPKLWGNEAVCGARLIAACDAAKNRSLDESARPAWPICGGAYQRESIRLAWDYAANMDAVTRKVGAVNLVHAHDWLTFPAAIHIKQRWGHPMIAHVHSTEHERGGARAHPAIVEIERQGLTAADRVIAVSYRTRRLVIERYGIAPDKIDVVHNAADHHPWQSPDEPRLERVVSFIGRITWQKGPSHFIEAAHKIARQFPDVRFVMAGDGDRLPMMKALAAARGIADLMQFPGFLDAAGVQALLARTTVYAMPSLSEPFGIGALEAIRSGVPVVLSNACGVSEVVRHATQVVAGDSIGLAEAIAHLLMHPKVLRRQTVLAQQEAAAWSWRHAAQAVHAAYQVVFQPAAQSRRRNPPAGQLTA